MLEGATIVVFADDWGIHPSSAQHLLRRFLQRNRVVWINTMGMRLPRPGLRDLKKALRKLAHWGGLHRPGAKGQLSTPGPEIHDLPLMPLPLGRLARSVNAWALRRALRRVAPAGARSGSVYIVSTLPLTADVMGAVAGAKFVYYAVDDYASWPGLGGKLVQAMDERQARGADVVIASSQALAALYAARVQRPVSYLPHGVDVAHFASARKIRHGKRASADVIFFGAIDERIDQQLLAEVIALRPALRFLLVGPASTRGNALAGARNVQRRGPVPYAELPQLLGNCQAALLPYVQTSFGMQIAPLKAREALAAGLPLVATDIPELHTLGRGVHLGRCAEELAAGLDRALAGQIDLPTLQELESDSWEVRAERFAELLLTTRKAA